MDTLNSMTSNNDNDKDNSANSICLEVPVPVPVVKKPKKKSNRCVICRKKVGLTGFTCACSTTNLFCSEHRLPENHSCLIDHKQKGREVLATRLVKIDGDKMIKI